MTTANKITILRILLIPFFVVEIIYYVRTGNAACWLAGLLSFAIAAILYGGIFRGEKLFGVDFLGGDSTTYNFKQKLDVEQIRSVVLSVGEKDTQIQYQRDIGAGKDSPVHIHPEPVH